MKKSAVNAVKAEMKRLDRAIKDMEEREKSLSENPYHRVFGDEFSAGPAPASVKRASLDLTRALAAMRRAT